MPEENYYTEEIAKDPNTSPEILAKILKRGNDDWVSRYAARNPSTPSEALAEELSRGKEDDISCIAANNPNCPPEALAEILSRGKNDWVSRTAAVNPSCPPLVKIQWMRQVGLIGKEDPNRHIIEYDSKIEVDEDLEKLKKMVSNK